MGKLQNQGRIKGIRRRPYPSPVPLSTGSPEGTVAQAWRPHLIALVDGDVGRQLQTTILHPGRIKGAAFFSRFHSLQWAISEGVRLPPPSGRRD